MSDEQSMSVALALVQRGILTQKAARVLSHFTGRSASQRMFCEALRMPNGEVGIVWWDRYYTPAEFNALVDDRTPPTPDDVVMSIRALALAVDPDAAPDTDTDAAAPEPEPAPTPTPASRPAPGTPEADAQLEALHQAASQRPGGTRALAWGLAALLFWLAVGIAALVFWRAVQLFWPR